MSKSGIFGIIALVALVAILFTPIDSTAWRWLLLAGIFFGLVWWIKKK